MVVVLLVNHGSRNPQFNRAMEGLAKAVEEALGVRAYPAYNEYAEPNWRDLVREINDDVVIALAFLGPGNHVQRDILGELGVEPGRWAEKFGKRIYVTPPLGDSPLVAAALITRIKAALGGKAEAVLDPAEIEEESMEKVAEALGLDLGDWRDRVRARAAYASGNLELARRVEIAGDVKRAVLEWTSAGGLVVADVSMTAAGLRYGRVEVAVKAQAEARGVTRAYAGVKKLLSTFGSAGVVVGNAPTAAAAAVEECAAGREIPFIVAAPPAFTNVHVKEEVLKCGVPAVVVKGTYGGSGVAAAIFNELARP